MKHFIKTFFLFVILIFFSNLYAQSNNTTDSSLYDDVFNFAQNLEQKGCFKEASTEYKRFLFLENHSSNINRIIANKSLAEYYQSNKQYELSLNYISNAISLELYSDKTDQKNLEKLQLLQIKILQNNANDSHLNLQLSLPINTYITFDGYSPEIRKTAWIALIKNQIINKKFPEAQLNFTNFCTSFPDALSAQDQLAFSDGIAKVIKFKPKNQKLAMGLSVIPGLGQLYAQNYADALNAFLLNGSLITLCTYSICTLNFLDFSLLELSPTIRFYKGNFANAKSDTINYNKNKINELSAPLLEILDKIDK